MNSVNDSITQGEIDDWRTYVGRKEVRRQLLDLETSRRFAVAVGSSVDVEREVPPLAHWPYFLDTLPMTGLAADGHPKRGGGLLPPVRLPSRMFAASSMRFIEPIKFDQEAELTLTLVDVKHRMGKSGDLVFVDVDRTLMQGGYERIAERQTYVYRGSTAPVAPIESVSLPIHPGEEFWRPDTVELFRFSAVTFNSHRIHFDLPYAREREKYPGLVVQGPLIAAKLFAFAAARTPHPLTEFSFRAMAPLFVNQTVKLSPGVEPGQFHATRCDGMVAMFAQANADRTR
jgi:3-methylfumaryl-CoA hydratase